MTTNAPKAPGSRRLLATMTQEPFQPVRLYYSIPDRSLVAERLRGLKCMVEVPYDRSWQWLYHAEAAPLPIGAGHDAVPVERRPIVLGCIRFPKNGGMTVQTNSIERAVAAARFFAPRLGPEVVALRCRLVNRCFAAAEGQPDELMKTLDRNVAAIDPRAAEATFAPDFEGMRTMEDADRAASEALPRKLASQEDVPMVEEFPLAPEEETSEFRDLATALGFRFVRAVEHWKGNTDLTLTQIIVRTVEDAIRRGAVNPMVRERTGSRKDR
jgi:hypothetical protein